jgi:phosphohistidine phosphatase SixA
MHLYLVQHGAAKTEVEDPQRGLTNAGRETIAAVAECLARVGITIARIEYSDKLRARQTAGHEHRLG